MKRSLCVCFVAVLALSILSLMTADSFAKPVTLKFGTWQAGGDKNPLTVGQYTYLDELEKRTNGAVNSNDMMPGAWRRDPHCSKLCRRAWRKRRGSAHPITGGKCPCIN